MAKLNKFEHPKWGIIDHDKVKVKEEFHDIWKHSKKIILGSMPPIKMTDQNKLCKGDIYYFYGSNRSHFWNILNYINDEKKNLFDVNDRLINYKNIEGKDKSLIVNERRNLLKKHNIGIIDLYLTCYHDRDGYSDKDIIIKEPSDWMPIDEILNECVATEIFCTSTYVKDKLIEQFAEVNNKDNLYNVNIKNVKRTFNIYVLSSPTFRSAGKLFNDIEKRKEFINSYAKLFDKEI